MRRDLDAADLWQDREPLRGERGYGQVHIAGQGAVTFYWGVGAAGVAGAACGWVAGGVAAGAGAGLGWVATGGGAADVLGAITVG